MTKDKKAVLAQQGVLNRASSLVEDPLFSDSEFFDPDDLIQVRYEMLRSVRTEARGAKDAAEAFGVSRATFYETLASFEQGGVAGLVPKKRGPRGGHKLTDEVVDFVETVIEQEPHTTSSALAVAIEERFQLSVHPRSIERALVRRKKKAPS